MRARGLWITAGVLLIAATTLVGWLLSSSKQSFDQEVQALRTRTEARVLHRERIPEDVVWDRMIPARGGALVFGRKAREGAEAGDLVLLALDSSGVVRSRSPALASRDCAFTRAVVAISSDQALVVCAVERGYRWFAVSVAAEPELRPLGQVDDAHAFSRRFRVVAAGSGAHHLWLIETKEDEWRLLSGEGLVQPSFAPLTLASALVSLAPFAAGEFLFASGGREIELSVLTGTGRKLRSVVVADAVPAGKHDSLSGSVFFDGKETIVAWGQQRKGSRFLETDSVLLARRYGASLEPLGPAFRVSDDRSVAHLRMYPLNTGSLLAWELGRREPWDVASFVRFRSVAEVASASVLRLPFGRFPASVVETERGLLVHTSEERNVPDHGHWLMLLDG